MFAKILSHNFSLPRSFLGTGMVAGGGRIFGLRGDMSPLWLHRGKKLGARKRESSPCQEAGRKSGVVYCTLHSSFLRIGNGNPKGIRSQSPGLRGTSYPGKTGPRLPTPTGLRPPPLSLAVTTPLGLPISFRRSPRVTRPSQPWAGGHNPFGIENGCKVQVVPPHSKLFLDSGQRRMEKQQSHGCLICGQVGRKLCLKDGR